MNVLNTVFEIWMLKTINNIQYSIKTCHLMCKMNLSSCKYVDVAYPITQKFFIFYKSVNYDKEFKNATLKDYFI